MTFSTFVGIFLIPVLFVVIERIFNRNKKNDGEGTQLSEQTAAVEK